MFFFKKTNLGEVDLNVLSSLVFIKMKLLSRKFQHVFFYIYVRMVNNSFPIHCKKQRKIKENGT